jgi:catechol 2,3-dioxygenase-like lactoylglutathione lyase family enzyme
MNLSIDHAHFFVRDLEDSITFFQKLRFEFIEYTKHGGKACMMKASGDSFLLELQETNTTQNPGLNHLAFTVDKLDELCKELEKQGIQVEGPLDNKNTGRKLATVRDTHGLILQIVQRQ